MHFSRFIKIATMLAALGVGTQTNAAPTVYGTYYDETTIGTGCSNLIQCRVFFSQLPSNKLTKVRRLHCVVATSQRVTEAYLEASTTHDESGSLSRFVPIPIPAASATVGNDGVYHAFLDLDTQWLIGQGRFPYVIVTINGTGNTINFNCTLIGDLIDPIQ